MPKDVEDTKFVVHPEIPPGTTLRELRETSTTDDYLLIRTMVESFRTSVIGCDEVGQYNLAKYPWTSKLDQKTVVSFEKCIETFESNYFEYILIWSLFF